LPPAPPAPPGARGESGGPRGARGPPGGGGGPRPPPAATAAEGTALPAAARRRRRLPAILAPLAERDFALLWLGRATSLLGDGVYPVALAFQVYALSNTPAALSIVGLALSVPQVLLFLLGGVLTDRLAARRVPLPADLLRRAPVG